MPRGLRRFHESGQSHFLTFSCYRRKANFVSADGYELFVLCLEEMRRRFGMCIYGYVVMPEHVHLLVSEPERTTLADAIHYLKLSFAKLPDLAPNCHIRPVTHLTDNPTQKDNHMFQAIAKVWDAIRRPPLGTAWGQKHH